VNPLLVAPKRRAVSSPSPASSIATSTRGASPASAPVVKGKPTSPQQPENMLEMGSAKKVDTSDHGDNCVCKDCRVKKIGKGGSLFPDL